MSNLIEYNKNFFKKIIVVGAYGRAGSGLLLSLLDSHPNIINFQDVALSGYQDWWDSLEYHDGIYVMNDFIDLFYVIFEPTFKHPSRTPPAIGNDYGRYSNFIGNNLDPQQKIYVPLSQFKECLSQIVSKVETSSEFYRKVHYSLAFALNKKINHDTIILHGATNATPQRLNFIYNGGFERIWHILMVRDPVYGHFAQINHWIEEKEDRKSELFLPDAINMMLKYNLMLNGWEESSIALKLEQLHKHPKETLKKLIIWLEIPWNDSLLESTFLGKRWQFSNNEKYSEVFNLNRISPDKYNFILNKNDYKLFSLIFHKLYKTWEYDYSINNNNHLLVCFFSKFKIEIYFKHNFKSYIRNRKFLILTFFRILFKKNKIDDKFPSLSNKIFPLLK